MDATPKLDSVSDTFRVGVTPDFYIDARGKFESVLDQKLAGVPGLQFGRMPDQPGKVATPDALNQFDALFSLSLKITADSLVGVDRLAVVARWGVGYDMIDVDALTTADVALAITPAAVRRPVAEAIFTFIFALSTNLLIQDKLVRQGRWRGDLPKLGRNIEGPDSGVARMRKHCAGDVPHGRIARIRTPYRIRPVRHAGTSVSHRSRTGEHGRVVRAERFRNRKHASK